MSFGSVLNRGCHRVEEPAVQLTTGSLTDVFGFGLRFEVQVFEDQDRSLGNPVAELCSCFLTERPVSVAGFPRQPFQHPAYRPGILVLCLLPGEFGLQPRSYLSCSGGSDLKRFTADDQCFLLGGSHHRISNAEVNSYRDYSFGFGNAEGYAEVGLSSTDTETVDAGCSFEIVLEVIWNLPSDLLSPLRCGYRKTIVPTKREISRIKK